MKKSKLVVGKLLQKCLINNSMVTKGIPNNVEIDTLTI